MKIQLVNPEVPVIGDVRLKYVGCWPHLGLLSMASYLKSKGHADVDIVDFNIKKRKIDADIVGISTDLGTYKHALDIAQKAKDRGCTTVLGGTWVSVLGHETIRNRDFVDIVVVGDGEIPLLKLVEQEKLESIPNLVFREGGQIKSNQILEPGLDQYGEINYSFVDLKPYFDNFYKIFQKGKRTLTTYSRKGCLWKKFSKCADKRGCIFCSIFDNTSRLRSTDLLWHEIMKVKRTHDLETIFDVADCFTEHLPWLQEFVSKKPEGSPKFYVFARTNQITEKHCKLLSALGVEAVYFGIESGSQKVLDVLNKGTTLKTNLNAVRLLAKNGIKADLSFIFGNPGENEKTIKETFDHFKELLSFGNVRDVEASRFRPLPGAPAFNMLNKKLRNKYTGKDILDIEILVREWVDNFCEIDYDEVFNAEKSFWRIVPGNLYE